MTLVLEPKLGFVRPIFLVAAFGTVQLEGCGRNSREIQPFHEVSISFSLTVMTLFNLVFRLAIFSL